MCIYIYVESYWSGMSSTSATFTVVASFGSLARTHGFPKNTNCKYVNKWIMTKVTNGVSANENGILKFPLEVKRLEAEEEKQFLDEFRGSTQICLCLQFSFVFSGFQLVFCIDHSSLATWRVQRPSYSIVNWNSIRPSILSWTFSNAWQESEYVRVHSTQYYLKCSPIIFIQNNNNNKIFLISDTIHWKH